MADSQSIERYKKLGIRESLCVPYKYPIVCKELAVILRFHFSKFPKSLQSLLFDHTLFAFRLLPQMQTQSAGSAANLLIQSAESAFPKQKRALAATEFKQAKIAYKRRGKTLLDDKDPVSLPQDVLVHLFCFLDVQTVLTAGLVCWSWNAAANDSYLWHFQYTKHFDLKVGGLSDDKTTVEKQLAPSSDTSANQDWKDDFRKTYLELPYKFDRGFCLSCKSVVWLNNLKCPNKYLGQKFKNHQLKPISPSQIGRYIEDGHYISRLLDSDDDSDTESDIVTESDEDQDICSCCQFRMHIID